MYSAAVSATVSVAVFAAAFGALQLAFPAVEKFCRASSAGGRLHLQQNFVNQILSVAEDCLSPAGSFHGCPLMQFRGCIRSFAKKLTMTFLLLPKRTQRSQRSISRSHVINNWRRIISTKLHSRLKQNQRRRIPWLMNEFARYFR